MSPTVTFQRIVPDAVLEMQRARVLVRCRTALARKARIEGYVIDLDRVSVTYRPAGLFRDGPATVVCLNAPTVEDPAT